MAELTIMERLAKARGEDATTVVVNVDTTVNVDTEELMADARTNISSSTEEVKKSDSGATKEVKYKTISQVLETETKPEKALKAVRKIITKFRKAYINDEDVNTLEPFPAASTMKLLSKIACEVDNIKVGIRSKNAHQKALDFKLYNNQLDVMVAVATNVTILRCLTTEDLGI